MQTKRKITAQGLEELKDELKRLKEEKQNREPALAVARAFGDSKENAELHSLRDLLNELEARISQIEYQIAHSHVVDLAIEENAHEKTVCFGSLVKIQMQEEEVRVYRIVGAYEAAAELGKISEDSPLAQAMIGLKEGNEFEITITRGNKEIKRQYKIIAIL